MKRRLVIVALGIGLVALPAYPCGGPGADIVDLPLLPVDRFLSRTLHNDEFEYELRAELRFLEPFYRGDTVSIGELYGFAYRGGYYDDTVDDTVRQRIDREMLGPVRARFGRGGYVEAVAGARRVVDAVLDKPAGVVAAYRDVLRSAVEFVDILPHLSRADHEVAARYFEADSGGREALAATTLPAVLREALIIRRLSRDSADAYVKAHPTTPRRASLRFVALQHAMRVGIPDGWSGAIADSVPPERWAALEALHDEWLRDFASHPMADYVRFSKVRLYYFKRDRERAWRELLAIYPRRRQRVLGEMRYLVYQGSVPQSLDDSRIDWPLRAALLVRASVSPAQWNAYWAASEAHRAEPWAMVLQERLLWRAMDLAESTGSLPSAFPRRAGAPTGLWAKLRLLALLQVGDIAAAFEQVDSAEALNATPQANPVEGDAHYVSDLDAIRTRLHLIRRDWRSAVAAAPNGDKVAEYLVRVLAPPPVVDSLAAAPDSATRRDALLTIAARQARSGDWASARGTVGRTREPALTRRWARTAALASDRSRRGQLAFARWMRDQRGALFFGEDTYWLRGLNWRRNALEYDGRLGMTGRRNLDPRLPWTAAEERARIEDHLRATTELYYALQAYARWLDGATASTPRLASVVREADAVYNRLVNWDHDNSRFWGEALETSAEARAIRRAGRLIRRR